ncbi:FAD synthetase family protein [Mesobacillus harenae]|uniref:FAD synthetase family protein n=1 Tax=Mesobacillus harenae TaxID=2213203 RepID=UPI00158099B4|nr:FAD synthetase family protein [Mesobacillus harenae]
MEVIYLSYPLNPDKKIDPSAMAIGFFDGIHLGHQKVIETAIGNAREFGVKSSVMTFDPHPKQVIGNGAVSCNLLTSLEEKIKLLEKMGIDIVYVVSFSSVLSKLSPEDFFHRFLAHLTPICIAIGFDFTFGRYGAGSGQDLKRMAYNRFKVTIVPPINDINGVKISSTLIRQYLKAGNLAAVNKYLGRNYVVAEEKVGDNIFA